MPWSIFQNSIIIPSPSSLGQGEAGSSVLVAVVQRVCICFQKMMYVIFNSFLQDSIFTKLIDALVTEVVATGPDSLKGCVGKPETNAVSWNS